MSDYDQEIPQSQTTDKPMAPQGETHNNHETPGKQTKHSNQLSLPHQDDCKTRRDIKQRTTNHRTITESHNGSNNKQQVNNNRTNALERISSQAFGGLKCMLQVPNLRPRFCCCTKKALLIQTAMKILFGLKHQ